MDDQIQISRCHVTVGGKITLLILLAGRKGKSEPAITPGWRSAGTPHRAHCRTCTESIPINPARTQTDRLNMYRMCKLGGRSRDSLRSDTRKSFILRHLPFDVDIRRWHAALFERPRRQPCPQNDTVLEWAPGRYANRVWIRAEDRRRTTHDPEGRSQCRCRQRACEKRPAVDRQSAHDRMPETSVMVHSPATWENLRMDLNSVTLAICNSIMTYVQSGQKGHAHVPGDVCWRLARA
jgi:hypothetical protein